ncbi:MAG: glycosyltransferase, partial [Gemmatimonadales bacterium]|nr:glycosyltransferase [Gemmatimonadales bacterium]
NAMAMGKPVVVCGARGARDYIAHRYDGILLDHGDVDGLRRAIDELLQRPGWAAAVGRRAQRRILAGPFGTDDCMRSVAELACRVSAHRLRWGRTRQSGATRSMEQTAELRSIQTTGLPRRG